MRQPGIAAVDTRARVSTQEQIGRILDSEPPPGTPVDPGEPIVVTLYYGDGLETEPGDWFAFTRNTRGGQAIGGVQVIVVDPEGDVRQLGPGESPYLAPDASRVAYISRERMNFDMLTVRPDGSDRQRLIDRDIRDGTIYGIGLGAELAWSPDGRSIAFVVPDKVRLSVISADGTGRRELVGVYGTSPSWSPDSTQIAFVESGGDGSPGGLTVAAMDGSTRRLTLDFPDDLPAPGRVVEVSWSPEGDAIVFSTESGGVYLADPDGTDLQQVQGDGTWHPSWSPGGEILFVSDESADSWATATGLVYTVSPDGTGIRPLEPTIVASSPVRWVRVPTA